MRTAEKLEPRDYTEEGQRQRKPNETGRVVDLSNCHGLCFEVQYDSGGHGWFDEDELTLLSRGV